MRYTTEKKHISTIRPGDTVLHNGVLETVSRRDIKRDDFMGITLFGDSYHLGYKPVLRAKIYHCKTPLSTTLD